MYSTGSVMLFEHAFRILPYTSNSIITAECEREKKDGTAKCHISGRYHAPGFPCGQVQYSYKYCTLHSSFIILFYISYMYNSPRLIHRFISNICTAAKAVIAAHPAMTTAAKMTKLFQWAIRILGSRPLKSNRRKTAKIVARPIFPIRNKNCSEDLAAEPMTACNDMRIAT